MRVASPSKGDAYQAVLSERILCNSGARCLVIKRAGWIFSAIRIPCGTDASDFRGKAQHFQYVASNPLGMIVGRRPKRRDGIGVVVLNDEVSKDCRFAGHFADLYRCAPPHSQ